jgi:hypothetical protein
MIGLALSLIVGAVGLAGAQEVASAPVTSAQPSVVAPAPGTTVPSKPAVPVKPVAPAEKSKDTKKVCRASDVTGSRLRRVQICRTTEEWIRIDEQAQRATRALLDPARGAPPRT